MNAGNGAGALPMTSPLVEAELERLISDAAPEMPASFQGLLEYLIRQARAGVIPNDRAIARDVFRRGDDYDPDADPIVRIQINRLRRRLEDHYQASPSPTTIVIEKGAVSLSAWRASATTPG